MLLLRNFAASVLLSSLFVTSSAQVQSSVEVVLARCRENIDWVDEMGYGPITTVYDKCKVNTGPGRHIERPNVGRESGTYLQHIVDNYDNLADWTVFSQAEKPSYGYRGHRLGGGHLMSNTLFQDYIEAAETKKENPLFFVFTNVLVSNNKHTFQCARQGYGAAYTKPEGQTTTEKMCGKADHWQQWYEFPLWFADMLQGLQKEQNAPITDFDVNKAFEVFNIQPTRGVTFFAQGARFAASREAIQARPKAYYEGILEHLQAQDPWAGYYLEWMWYYILGGRDAPCGFEEPVLNGHLSWERTTKGREDFAVQATSGVSGSQDPDVRGGTFTTDFTFTIDIVVTTTSLRFTGVTLTFELTFTFLVPTGTIVGNSVQFFGQARITAAAVAVSIITLGADCTMDAPLVVSTELRFQTASGAGSGAIITVRLTGVVSGRMVGRGTLRVTGRGRRFRLRALIIIVITIRVEITITSSARRTDITNLPQNELCGVYQAGTVALNANSVLIPDLSCSVTQSGFTSYSSYVGTLSPAAGLIYFEGVSSSSKPLGIGSVDPSAVTLEVANITSGGTFCTTLVVYGSTLGSCVQNPQVIIDGCSGTCSTSGGTFSGNSSLCQVQFCQTANSNSDNGGLYGLIALVALVPLAALAGFGVWYFMKGSEEPAYNQYYYPEPYPQAAYPQVAYPQYAPYGAEAGYPFQGGFYDPGFAAPQPTPLGFTSL